jgi:hypothetical protein
MSQPSDGYIIITDERGFREMDTRLCPHCGGHFIIVPGSGKWRNYCHACDQPTCDKVKCHTHDPFQKRLDLVEAGKLPLRAL